MRSPGDSEEDAAEAKCHWCGEVRSVEHLTWCDGTTGPDRHGSAHGLTMYCNNGTCKCTMCSVGNQSGETPAQSEMQQLPPLALTDAEEASMEEAGIGVVPGPQHYNRDVMLGRARQIIDGMQAAGRTEDVPNMEKLNNKGMRSTNAIADKCIASGQVPYVSLGELLRQLAHGDRARKRRAKMAAYVLHAAPDEMKPTTLQVGEEQDGQYQALWPRRVEALDSLSELISDLHVHCRMSIVAIADGLIDVPFAAPAGPPTAGAEPVGDA